jgi:hypothetical protein
MCAALRDSRARCVRRGASNKSNPVKEKRGLSRLGLSRLFLWGCGNARLQSITARRENEFAIPKPSPSSKKIFEIHDCSNASVNSTSFLLLWIEKLVSFLRAKTPATHLLCSSERHT